MSNLKSFKKVYKRSLLKITKGVFVLSCKKRRAHIAEFTQKNYIGRKYRIKNYNPVVFSLPFGERQRERKKKVFN